MLIALVLLPVVFIPMLIEARVAAINERRQRERGGVEPSSDVYAIMRIAYPAVFLAMIAEGVWRPGHAFVLAGAVLFVLAKCLKSWAIVTLREAWTFRVIVRPDVPLVTSGPYRVLCHPNYVAVVGELVGVALMSGARVAGPLGTIFFSLLMLRRISVEEEAIEDVNRPI